MSHLEYDKDIMAHTVIVEYYRNNRKELMNNKKLKHCVWSLCNYIKELPLSHPLKINILNANAFQIPNNIITNIVYSGSFNHCGCGNPINPKAPFKTP